MKNLFFLAIVLCISNVGNAQTSHDNLPQGKAGAGKITWLTVEQAYAANQKQPRKWMIDVYTDWCGWCKVMDRETFTNPKVADYVAKNYYAVKLNAEQREPIMMGKEKFDYVSQGNGGYNLLAAKLMNGQMSFPTVVFLDEKLQMIQPLPGFQKADIYHQVITFFGGNHYKSQAFDKFQQDTYVKQYTAAE